jgi:hypothetical protein
MEVGVRLSVYFRCYQIDSLHLMLTVIEMKV